MPGFCARSDPRIEQISGEINEEGRRSMILNVFGRKKEETAGGLKPDKKTPEKRPARGGAG